MGITTEEPVAAEIQNNITPVPVPEIHVPEIQNNITPVPEFQSSIAPVTAEFQFQRDLAPAEAVC